MPGRPSAARIRFRSARARSAAAQKPSPRNRPWSAGDPETFRWRRRSCAPTARTIRSGAHRAPRGNLRAPTQIPPPTPRALRRRSFPTAKPSARGSVPRMKKRSRPADAATLAWRDQTPARARAVWWRWSRRSAWFRDPIPRAPIARTKLPPLRPPGPGPCACAPPLPRRRLPLAPGFAPGAPLTAPQVAFQMFATRPRSAVPVRLRQSQTIAPPAPANAPAPLAAAIRMCVRWIPSPRATRARRSLRVLRTTLPARPCAPLQSRRANSPAFRQPARQLRADYFRKPGASVRDASAGYLPAAPRAPRARATAPARAAGAAPVWPRLQIRRVPGIGGSANPEPEPPAAQRLTRDFPCGDAFPPSAHLEFFPGAGAVRSPCLGSLLPAARKIPRCGWPLVLLPPASCGPSALPAPAQTESPQKFRAPRLRLAQTAGAILPAAPSFSARRCAAFPANARTAGPPSVANYCPATIATVRSIGPAPRTFPIPGAAARRLPRFPPPQFLLWTAPQPCPCAPRPPLPAAVTLAPPGWWPPARFRFPRAALRRGERSPPTVRGLARIFPRIPISACRAPLPASQSPARKIPRAPRPVFSRSRSSTSRKVRPRCSSARARLPPRSATLLRGPAPPPLAPRPSPGDPGPREVPAATGCSPPEHLQLAASLHARIRAQQQVQPPPALPANQLPLPF